MTLNERLDQLAELGDGQISVGPDVGQDLESFQGVVAMLREYDQRGLMVIVSEHAESTTGRRYIDRVRLRLTSAGVDWRGRKNS